MRTRYCLSIPILALALSSCGGAPTAPPIATPAPTPVPTPTPPPATLADLTATVTSPESHHTINCRQDLHATVAITNRALSDVSVVGVKMTSHAYDGCGAPEPFTYRPLRHVVPAGQTVVVLDQALFTDGSGCCYKASTCSGTCSFEEVFVVKTSIGDVEAGAFGYRIRFEECLTCPAPALSSALDAGPAPAYPSR